MYTCGVTRKCTCSTVLYIHVCSIHMYSMYSVGSYKQNNVLNEA